MGLGRKIVLVWLALVLLGGLCDRWHWIWRARRDAKRRDTDPRW